ILNVILGCLLVWQTLATMREISSERVARVSALLVAVFPTLVFYTATLSYETLLALVLVVACRLTVFAARSTRPATALVAIGVVLGWGTLVKPICLLMPALVGLAWWMLGVPVGTAVRRAALVTVVTLLCISPWTMRNYRVFGQFVPVS